MPVLTTLRAKSAVILLYIFFLPFSYAQSTLVWLKPIESDQKMVGNTIVEGAALDLMQFVANEIVEVKHQFEAYPIQRSWRLIKNSKQASQVSYCFWGADYKKEREEWGYFTEPTSVTLPYMIAARKNEIAQYEHQGVVSVKQLLKDNFSTIIFENVVNPWRVIVEQANRNDVVEVSELDQDISDHTLKMIEKKRIDFGFISHRTITNLTVANNANISLYKIAELKDDTNTEGRLLCSKTPHGKKMVTRINQALDKIRQQPELRAQLKSLIFEAEGYPEHYRTIFDKRFDKVFP